MNLYKVEIEKVIMVLAEDELDAERIGNRHSSKEEAEHTSVSKVTSITQVPEDWLNGLPYGGIVGMKEPADKLWGNNSPFRLNGLNLREENYVHHHR